jgi:hypothetical protein
MAASASTDALINRRGRHEANSIEEAWSASEKRQREERHKENREAWITYYRGLARVHHGLAADHDAKADALEGVA